VNSNGVLKLSLKTPVFPGFSFGFQYEIWSMLCQTDFLGVGIQKIFVMVQVRVNLADTSVVLIENEWDKMLYLIS